MENSGDFSLRLIEPHKVSFKMTAISYLLIAIGTALIIFFAAKRSLFDYGTETDYVGSMILEAKRLLNGEPLRSEFHPPGYIFTIASAYLLHGDWFTAGRNLSVLSSAVTMLASFGLFRLIAGPFAGLGAVVGLLSSATFVTYSMQASSDVFFLALFYVTFLLAAYATIRGSLGLWVAVGALVVFTIMTRTNGITLILVLFLPLFLSERSKRPIAFAGGVAGLALTVLAFVAFARLTGSNLMPMGTYHNLAITYFTDERMAWEGMLESRARFKSLMDVLTYDPLAMAERYVRDLLDVALRRLPELAGVGLALLFLPGLLHAAGQRSRPLLGIFLAFTLIQFLLVNLKAYEARYHLYFVPWIGAGAAISLSLIAQRKDWFPILRVPVLSLSALIVLVGGLYSWKDVRNYAARGGNPELTHFLPYVQQMFGPEDVIVSRKSSHLSYYTGATRFWLPEANTVEELKEALASAQAQTDAEGSVYLFMGEVERRARKDVARLLSDRANVPWLETVAAHAEEPQWELFRYQPSE